MFATMTEMISPEDKNIIPIRWVYPLDWTGVTDHTDGIEPTYEVRISMVTPQ